MKTLKLATMAIILILSNSANADLIGHKDGQAYYDTGAGLSWLADANDRAATEFTAYPLNGAWAFSFGHGDQVGRALLDKYFALAVHDGDITVVSVPAAAWLFSVGLVGLFGIARRKPEVVSKKSNA